MYVDDGKSGRQAYDYVPVQKGSEITKQTKLAGDIIIIDTITPHHMVPAESELCQHVVNKIDCCMRVRGSCGLASSRKKGTLAFRARNDRGKLVPIYLEVIRSQFGASAFSVGALHENGLEIDLMSSLILLFYATVTSRFLC